MRTLLAVASFALLVGTGVGCGDDTTTATMDMAMAHDLAVAVPHDMTMLSCAQILTCSEGCTTSSSAAACAQACVTSGTTAAQSTFQALELCVLGQCGGDGGIDINCFEAAVAGPCMTQYAACTG